MKTLLLTTLILFSAVAYCKAQAPETMLDKSFGLKGILVYTDSNRSSDTGYRFEVQKMAMQGNKIIVAGQSINNLRIITQTDTSTIVRLNSNGTIDRSFGISGVFKFAYPHLTAANILALHCQIDGKIIGLFYTGTYYIEHPKAIFINGMFRLNANGSIDTTFGKRGFKLLANDQQDMLVLPDDNIIVAALKTFNNNKRGYTISKYTNNGILITSDSVKIEKPYSLIPIPTLFLRLSSNNKIVMAGEQKINNTAQRFFSLFRYNYSLERDMAYGDSGRFSYKYSTEADFDNYFLGDMTIQKNGNAVAAFNNGYSFLKLIGVTNKGRLDSSFGTNGEVKYPYPHRKSLYVKKLLTQKDDKVVALIDLGLKGLCVGRLNSNGSIDSSFGNDGISYTKVNTMGKTVRCYQEDMILQPDGKVLVGADGSLSTGMFNDYEGAVIVARCLTEKVSDDTVAKTINKSLLQTDISAISISPNPVKDILTITSKNLYYKNILIVDVSGRVMLKSGFAGNTHSINVSGLSAGIYYLKAAPGNVLSTKFVKN